MDLLTFDNESELHKIKEFYPLARYTDHPYNGPQVNVYYQMNTLMYCRLVLRIVSDDPNAITPLGNKFGRSVADGKLLLSTAKSLGLKVVGIWSVFLTLTCH